MCAISLIKATETKEKKHTEWTKRRWRKEVHSDLQKLKGKTTTTKSAEKKSHTERKQRKREKRAKVIIIINSHTEKHLDKAISINIHSYISSYFLT